MDAFSHRSLLDIEGLTRADVERILDTAEAFLQVSRRPVRKVPTLRGKTVINLFYEASTRTRTSFELAGKRLSADVINMSVSASSVEKGETLQDTCRTLEAMHPGRIDLGVEILRASTVAVATAPVQARELARAIAGRRAKTAGG